MSAWNRYVTVSMLLAATIVPLTGILVRRYGASAARRFSVGMAGSLASQQALVGLALERHARTRDGSPMHSLTAVDLLTLSRGVAAAVLVGLTASGIRDRRGPAGWLGWGALLYGSILCDWLDGPIARRTGTSELGALFDLELDSWLTLCTGGAAIAWGDLPPATAGAPVLRYVLLFTALRSKRYEELHRNEPGWVRPVGIGQMLLFIAALAPFGGRATWEVLRFISPVAPPIQITTLLLLQRRRLGA